MTKTLGFAVQSATSPFAPLTFERRAPRPEDVSIEILYCGVCHTDMHFAHDDWGMSTYPLVPGHEIIGRVTGVGAEVTRYEVGDLVGVGCMVDSCRTCAPCDKGLEQYCIEGMVPTYNGTDRIDGSTTYGGYSEHIIVPERFVVRVPDGLDPATAAPILCAGITTFSPLRHRGVKPGDKVGVVGMGGLGHMAIKLARAMGADVTVFSRSEAKAPEARRNGANHVVVSADSDAMAAAAGTLDTIVDTVPVQHDVNPYLATLTLDGVYILVGQLTPLDPPVDPMALIFGRRVLTGSLIGGLPETQEVLDFCAEHGVSCDIEMIKIQDIDAAYERLARGDVRYRFVIDMASLKASAEPGA